MAKHESTIVVKRKLQSDIGKNTPSEDCIKKTFGRFCETGTVKDRERSERPSTITEETVDEIHNAVENHSQPNIRTVATACSILPTTTFGITTEYLHLKPTERCSASFSWQYTTIFG